MKEVTWSEHNPTSLVVWKSLRSQLRMFLYAVSNGIDFLVDHFSSLDLDKVANK